MQIHRPQENKLEIFLTQNDMDELQITYAALDTIDLHTRRVLRQLLEAALAQTGFCPDGRRLLVQAFPAANGGCQLYFTLLPQEPAACCPALFAFDNSENLICCCRCLYQQHSHRLHQSSLYRFCGKYYLALYCLDHPAGAAACLAGEYGQLVAGSSMTLAVLQEHGQTIADQEAVELVHRFFFESSKKS